MDNYVLKFLSHSRKGCDFVDPKQRDALYDALKRDPTQISYGTAFSQAKLTTSGLLGNDSDLFNTCALLMMYELHKRQIELQQGPDVLHAEVVEAPRFKQAYHLVRIPTERLLDDIARTFGHKDQKTLRRESRDHNFNFPDFHDVLIREIRDYPSNFPNY